MKKLYTILALMLLLSISVSAQIPNGGFESWTNGKPDSWSSNNVEGMLTTVTKSTDAHTGSAALKGEVVNVNGIGVIGPIVYTDEDNNSTDGFIIDKRYNSISGFYKLNSPGNDQIAIIVTVYSGSEGVGAGVIQLQKVGTYTKFTLPILYIPSFNGVPDRCGISVQVFDSKGASDYNEGTAFFIDDFEISMGNVSDVEENTFEFKNQLMQNSPNPFSTITSINFNVAESNLVTLKVYDILGNEVMTLLNKEMTVGSYNVPFEATSAINGVYFYKLTIGNFSETRMMQITK